LLVNPSPTLGFCWGLCRSTRPCTLYPPGTLGRKHLSHLASGSWDSVGNTFKTGEPFW
jgi:hypothetical protein